MKKSRLSPWLVVLVAGVCLVAYVADRNGLFKYLYAKAVLGTGWSMTDDGRLIGDRPEGAIVDSNGVDVDSSDFAER